MTDYIRRMSTVGSVIMFFICVVPSYWVIQSSVLLWIESFLTQAASVYDSVFLEITVRNGQISSHKKHFYLLSIPSNRNVAFVIDTAPMKFVELCKHLKEFDRGAVLGRDAILIKNERNEYIVPVPELPDIVLNSVEIDRLVRQYFSTVTRCLRILIAAYVLASKLAQVAILGFTMHLLAGRLFSLSLTYRQAINYSLLAILPPTLFEFILTKVLHNRVNKRQ